MSRMSVTIDDDLIDEAQKILGAQTRSEAVRIALSETIRKKRLAQALEHRGQISLSGGQEDLARQRAEE